MAELATALLILPDGRLVFQRRDLGIAIAPGMLALFGGHVESGETAEQAIYRELAEEISLDTATLTVELMCDYRIRHLERGNEEYHYNLYRTNVPHADFEVYEGSGAEVYTAEEVLRRDDITQSTRYAVTKHIGG